MLSFNVMGACRPLKFGAGVKSASKYWHIGKCVNSGLYRIVLGLSTSQ